MLKTAMLAVLADRRPVAREVLDRVSLFYDLAQRLQVKVAASRALL
jgi:hypothetical protein